MGSSTSRSTYVSFDTSRVDGSIDSATPERRRNACQEQRVLVSPNTSTQLEPRPRDLRSRPPVRPRTVGNVRDEDGSMATHAQPRSAQLPRDDRAGGHFLRAHSRRAHFMLPACNSYRRSRLQAAPSMNDPPESRSACRPRSPNPWAAGCVRNPHPISPHRTIRRKPSGRSHDHAQ